RSGSDRRSGGCARGRKMPHPPQARRAGRPGPRREGRSSRRARPRPPCGSGYERRAQTRGEFPADGPRGCRSQRARLPERGGGERTRSARCARERVASRRRGRSGKSRYSSSYPSFQRSESLTDEVATYSIGRGFRTSEHAERGDALDAVMCLRVVMVEEPDTSLASLARIGERCRVNATEERARERHVTVSEVVAVALAGRLDALAFPHVGDAALDAVREDHFRFPKVAGTGMPSSFNRVRSCLAVRRVSVTSTVFRPRKISYTTRFRFRI